METYNSQSKYITTRDDKSMTINCPLITVGEPLKKGWGAFTGQNYRFNIVRLHFLQQYRRFTLTNICRLHQS